MKTLKLKVIAVFLLIALIAPAVGNLSSLSENTSAESAQKLYPETILLELINEGKLKASNQIISILEEAAQARQTNSTLADILVAQAFMMLSNQTTHQCRGLYRIAIGMNYTVTKLINMVYRLNTTTKGYYNAPLTQALTYLEEAKANITKALDILKESNGNCSNGTPSTVSHYLTNARDDIIEAKHIIDSLTACHFKQVIMKTLEKRLVQSNMKIQMLAVKKVELENKGLKGPAKNLMHVEEKLSKENKVLINTIKELNNTVNCTKLWITMAAFKMLHNYGNMQAEVISHFQNRASMMEKSQMHLTMISFRLQRASEIISDIEQNAALPQDVKNNLKIIATNLNNITSLYHKALIEAWNGSPNLNQTELNLLSLINETQGLIQETTNMLPKGFKETQGLLKSVSKLLSLVEEMARNDFKGMQHAGRQIRMAKEIVYKMEVRTLMKDTKFAIIVGQKSCNSTNNTVINNLRLALQYLSKALNTDNTTVAMSNLKEASSLVYNAEVESGTICPQVQPVLIILEMEYNTTLTILS